MVKYICPKCDKIFDKKSNYIYHTEKRKNSCEKNILLINYKNINGIIKNSNNLCIFCKKIFSRNDSLYRHIKNRCKIKNIIS